MRRLRFDRCQPNRVIMMDADLSGADLSGANLTGADLSRADLSDVIGADFSGALNVPAEYLKD